ncbi:MAG: nucleotide disphospho-sugar-binding domain-containing protein [Pseudomonadota bacterium]
MSRILFAWELGGGYGHIAGFLPVALSLRECGHEVIFALKDVSHAAAILGAHRFPYVQAPIWLPKLVGVPEPVSYAEILFRFGYLSASGLTGLFEAWRRLFEWTKPGLMVADHSPTALLASRGMGMPRAMIGNGFFSPPRTNPLPSMRPMLKVPQARLADSERRVLEVANSVLAGARAPQLPMLADLFDVEENFLCTFPELDHYPGRGGGKYWGPRFSLEEGAAIVWPEGGGKKIFAYLKPGYLHFEKILQALADLPARTVIHAPSLPESLLSQYQRPHMKFYRQPVRMKQAAEECDLAVCHGGAGTVSAMLLAGRPILLLPMHLEQHLLACRAAELGAALMVDQDNADPNYAELLGRLLVDPAYSRQAQAFAEGHADFDQREQSERIARRCEELIRNESV